MGARCVGSAIDPGIFGKMSQFWLDGGFRRSCEPRAT